MNIDIKKTSNSKISEVNFDDIKFGQVFSDHMFVVDYEDGEWKDAKIIPFDDFKIHPATSALHYGQSVFEGMKAYKNEEGELFLFRPDENIKRLNQSADRMCMAKIPEDLFMEGLTKLVNLDKNWIPDSDGGSLYIRPFMFATDEFVGIRPSLRYKFIIFTCPVNAYYSEPVNVKFELEYTRAPKGGVGFAKTSGNYAASLYPAKLAQEQGYHQLIWTDGQTHEYIEESGTMNIMFRIGDTYITPKSSDSILPGITRRSVVDVARAWGLDVQEREVSVKEVVAALREGTVKEAFGLGTAATVARIAKIGYKDEEFVLPEIKEDDFAIKVLNYLEDLKHGKEEDKFGWIKKI